MQWNKIAQESWEMHFVGKKLNEQYSRRVCKQKVNTQRKKQHKQSEHSCFVRWRSQAHDTVTSCIVAAATKIAASSTASKSHMAEHGM